MIYAVTYMLFQVVVNTYFDPDIISKKKKCREEFGTRGKNILKEIQLW